MKTMCRKSGVVSIVALLLPILLYIAEDCILLMLYDRNATGYLSLGLCLLCLPYLIYKYNAWPKKVKFSSFLILALLIFLYVSGTTALHFIVHQRNLELAFTSLFLITSLMFFLFPQIFPVNKMLFLKACVLLHTVLIILQYLIYPRYYEIRMSRFLTNVYIFIVFLFCLLPINFLYLKLAQNRSLLHLLSWLNIWATIICAVWSGSRFFTVLVVLTMALCFFAFGDIKKGFYFKIMVVSVIALVTLILMYSFNIFWSAPTIGRALWLDKITSLQPAVTAPTAPTAPTAQYSTVVQGQTISSANLSELSDMNRTSLRENAVKDILRSPIWGRGSMVYLVSYVDHDAYIGPHNFILETLLNYGFIGLFLYALILAHPIGRYMKMIRPSSGNPTEKLAGWAALIVLFIMLSSSMFQPIMQSQILLLFLWLFLGVAITFGADWEGA